MEVGKKDETAEAGTSPIETIPLRADSAPGNISWRHPAIQRKAEALVARKPEPAAEALVAEKVTAVTSSTVERA